MTNRLLPMIGSLVIGAAHAVAVQAGTLTPMGSVLVNRGHGFEVVTQTTICDPVDQVLVQQGAAQIAYPDGSRADLVPGRLYIVGRTRRDRDEHGGIVPHGPSVAQGGGGTVAVGSGASGAGISTTGLIVGGLVAAGAAGLLISSGSKPSSP